MLLETLLIYSLFYILYFWAFSSNICFHVLFPALCNVSNGEQVQFLEIEKNNGKKIPSIFPKGHRCCIRVILFVKCYTVLMLFLCSTVITYLSVIELLKEYVQYIMWM